MTAIINGVTVFGSPEEVIRLMQLAGCADYQYSYYGMNGTTMHPKTKESKNQSND